MLREGVAVVEGKDLLLIRRELVTALARFLRERDRIDEAEAYEAELAGYDSALTPATSVTDECPFTGRRRRRRTR